MDREPVELEGRARGAAEPDGVDPDAAVGGSLGGRERIGRALLSPSVSRTIEAASWDPAGTGVGSGVGSGDRFE